MAWTYASLTSAIKTWMENTSTDFSQSVDSIILLGEQRINRDVALRVFQFTASGSTTTAITLAFPTNLQTVRSVRVTDPNGREQLLLEKHESYLNEFWPDISQTGTPKYWAVANANLRLAPTPTTGVSYKIEYTANSTGLAGATDGTWISTHLPDLLLYACLAEASLYEKESGQEGDAAVWEQRYQNALVGVKLAHEIGIRSEEYRRGTK